MTGSKLRRFQTWTENYVGFTPILFFGRGIFQYNYGIVPYRKAITIVVGKPIRSESVETNIEKEPFSPTALYCGYEN
jgi:2-acylglycerol O-acyltransferase 2